MTLVTGRETAESSASEVVPGRPRTTAGRARRLGLNLRGLGFALLLLLFLQALTVWVVDSVYVPTPSEVLSSLWNLVMSGQLIEATGQTVRTFAIGLLLASVLGVTAGVVLGASRRTFDFFRLVIEFLRPLPSVALIPFAILVFGVGSTATITMVTYASFWPILFNTYYGVRDADPVAVDTARNFGLRRTAVLRRVLLPMAATNIAAGIRISAAIALILTITVELITSSGGLGYFIVRMQTAIRVEDMYAGVFAVGLLGYVVNLGVRGLERRVVFWKPDVRDGGNS
jgi:ABC-type nitrate/sulfonate/bicarbonate transport system permease component